ncbi:MAG: N-acetylmuramoyl-L-alanine amidase [Sarcina sp.]
MSKKVAHRGGHNTKATGASNLIDEVIEDRKVNTAVGKYLKILGATTLDVTAGPMNKTPDLHFGVDKANSWKANLFTSIHFNNAYTSYVGAIGVECWIYKKGGESEVIATRICNNLAALGFKNRGPKVSPKLFELRETHMEAVIVEVCFVEATKDVELYRRLGPDKVGKAIAEGIMNKKVPTSATMYRVITGSFKERSNANTRVATLKTKGFDSFIEYFEKNGQGYFRVITGSFSNQNNANTQVAKLKNKGFDSFLEIYKN